MTTKQYLLTVKVLIKDKSMASLKLAVTHLEEKLDQVKHDLENVLTDFDLTIGALTSQEIQAILKDLVNFKGQKGAEMIVLNTISDFFFPKKKSADEEVISTKKQKEETDFAGLTDKDSLYVLFPFSWEQYPTYI